MTDQTNHAAALGHTDEPHDTGAIVAVHYGDYRHQEIWVNSGSNIGNWYCLGGEHGVPRPCVDVPLHPRWEDILRRGPVTLLTPGSQDTYTAGWTAGRRRLVEQMEAVSDDRD